MSLLSQIFLRPTSEIPSSAAAPLGGSPAEFKDYLNREVVKWGQVIKETGVEQQ